MVVKSSLEAIRHLVMTVVLTIGPVMIWLFFLPLPLLLKFSSTASYYWFSVIFPPIAGQFKVHFVKIKEQLFQQLMDEKRSLRIMEVGSGSGSNFPFYPRDMKSNVIALDPNEYLFEMFKQNAKQFPNISISDYVQSSVEKMPNVPDSSIDVIICTHVLCSVSDIHSAVSEMKRILKPNGRIFLMEHTRDYDSSFSFAVQQVLNIFWTPLFAGCNLNKDTLNIIKAVGFNTINLKFTHVSKIPFTLSPHIYGVITK